MKLTIYGKGCSKCEKLQEYSESAALALGLDYEVEKVTDMNRIIDAGIMHTPALAVNGEVVLEGRIGSINQITELLKAAS
ncbi:MAG: thioredoxin family protein [Gammaproteobacteria bacterium]|nr:MAG: thioredoxin family protein [Gammaproteobacteria bacterium]